MSDLIHMKNNRKNFQAELAKGRVWKTGDAYRKSSTEENG